ncbi:MAG: endonuclease Q family protein [Nitrososphaerota archaeon]
MTRVIADLQIHSRYSGATSPRMVLHEIGYHASLKGLNLLGTGDALHPQWFRELRSELSEVDGTGLYRLKSGPSDILFIIQTEVATVHEFRGKTRRIHHVILFRGLEEAKEAAEVLSRYGDISSDGRPVLNVRPAELVERVLEVDEDCFIFPAHAWTPWWSIFGSIGGVDRVEECYEDMADKIYAIETGLSSDPPMNWRVSSLDRYVLLSSSDSHSPYPYRLGREAVVFKFETPSYRELVKALKTRDKTRVLMTLEVPPSYGKYHWSGHRKCGVGPVPPEKAREMDYKCPRCRRRLTKGVEDRVEELADRPRGYRPPDAIDFMYVIPLQELIALSINMDYTSETLLQSRKIWSEYSSLVNTLGNEYKILLDTPTQEIGRASNERLASLIEDMRRGELEIIPGYDGVYGKILPKSSRGDRRIDPRTGTLEDYL